METAIGNLVSSIFLIVLGSFIWAVILMFAVKLVKKSKVEYWNAYMTVLLPCIFCQVLEFIIFVSITAGMRPLDVTEIIILFILPAYFFIQAGFVSYRIKIPFGEACIVTIVYIIGMIFFFVAIFFLPILFYILFIGNL